MLVGARHRRPRRRVDRPLRGGTAMLFRRRSRRIVTAAAASVGLVAIFVVLVLPVLIVPTLIVDRRAGATGTTALGPIDRLKAENDVRSTLLQGAPSLPQAFVSCRFDLC